MSDKYLNVYEVVPDPCTMVLPILRPNFMENAIPTDRLDRIQSHLVSVLSRPSAIETSDAVRFLSSYLGDLSLGALRLESNSNTRTKGHAIIAKLRSSIALKDTALGLLEHLAATSAESVAPSLFVDAVVTYSGSKYDARMRALANTIFAANPHLPQEILTALQTATQSCFGPRISPNDTLKSLNRAMRTLALILHTSDPSLLTDFTGPNNARGISVLAQIYEQLLPSVASALSQSSRPMAQALVRGEAEWAKTWLGIKISILDVLRDAFSFLSSKLSPSDDLAPLTAFTSLLAVAQSASPQYDQKTLLVDSPLLVDYERLFHLSATLRTRGLRDGGPTATFASIAERLQVDNAVIRLLVNSGSELEKTPVVRRTELPVPHPVPVDPKGKGRARATHEEPDPTIEAGISTILSILPDQDPDFLRRCLRHPDYSREGGVERLMGALLEGSVPIELSTMEAEPHEALGIEKGEDEVDSILRGRENVLDTLQIDISSLRIGKKQDTADQLLDDAWRKEMKADILRRAQEDSEEEKEGRYGPVSGEIGRHKFIPFDEDEFDDDFGSVSVTGDGETSDGEDDVPDEKVPVETRLELIYLESPALFNRDAATRRSTGRKALRAETGWSDEQIEGWKIMLERNPRKDQILEKHQFRGNKAAFPHGVEPKDSGNSNTRGGRVGREKGRGRGGGRGEGDGNEVNSRGRGGAGTPRGRGGRGRGSKAEGPNTERDRAWKEKNKSRGKQRGHDRKMAGGGGGAPA